jgi:hypothetical protein
MLSLINSLCCPFRKINFDDAQWVMKQDKVGFDPSASNQSHKHIKRICTVR